MTDQLVMRLKSVEANASSAVEWMLFDTHSNLLHHDQSVISELAAHVQHHSEDYDIHVLVPSDSGVLLKVSIPSQQMRQIKLALPFMVEELIAEEIENVHMAIPKRLDHSAGQGASHIDVGVVAHSILINWLDTLHSNDLSPTTICFDSLCLPHDGSDCSVMVEGGKILIRTGQYAGLCSTMLDFELLFQSLQAQWEAGNASALGRPRIRLITSQANAEDSAESSKLSSYLREFHSAYEIKEEQFSESLNEILAGTWMGDPAHSMNLLQGGYQVKSMQGSGWQNWRLAASIAGIGFATYLLLTIASGWYFSGQARALEQQSYSLYKQLFPNERRVVSPKKQMQNHIRQQGGAGSGNEFLRLLAQASDQFNGANSGGKLSVNKLRFDVGRGDLQFEIESESIEQLDTIKRVLADVGLEVDINSASELDDTVVSRLVVRRL